MAAMSLSTYLESSEKEHADIDLDSVVGFGLIPVDYMYTMKCSNNNEFTEGQIVPYGNIQLSPAAAVLNYGQGLFEGMKAFRQEDGRIVLFRPDQNAMRMKMGAERLCMPSPSADQFIDAVKQTALSNKRWIPPPGKGFLYIRPLLFGTGQSLGLSPAPECTLVIYASPVRSYFKEGSDPLNLYVEDEFDRASPGGAGGVKSITNYGPALKPLMQAKSRGFSEVLYLDSVNKKYVEEVSTCNIFVVKDKMISTPPAKGTILAGVTRTSIIEIARDHGYLVEERLIEIEKVLEADEAFCTANAIGVFPVGSITYQGRRVEYKMNTDSICMWLFSAYISILNGDTEDTKGWIVEIN